MLRTFMTKLGTFTGHPIALAMVILYGFVWYLKSPETLDWIGVAALATWGMTVLIQRATHRDTQALHAKLDELLISSSNACSELAEIDNKEPEDIVLHRKNAAVTPDE